MSRFWRGVMFAGVLAAGQPGGPVTAAPLLAATDARQPAPPPVPGPTARPTAPEPPRPPAPETRPRRDSERRAARAATQERRRAEHVGWRAGDQEPIVKMFTGGDGVTLDLLNMSGDVSVVGGTGKGGKLTVVRRVRGGQDAERLSRELDVVVAEHANRISVRTRMPAGHEGREFMRQVRTDYEIALPAGMALELKNLQGNVTLVNVPGDVRVEAYAGDVVAEALSRVRMLRSMSGDVMLTRSTVEGDANLQSVSGDVVAQAVKATSLTLGTVSGSVHVKESTSLRALVRTVSGDIEFAAAPRRSGRYELKSHGGNIVVSAPGGPGFEFEASTFKGEVQSDVPTQAVVGGARQVRGSVGDGSAFFELTSFTGDIRIRKKE